ncbi:uncharacterized protein SPPG_09253 [Spizellomyces punctatus DAOM BR117]|uniref:Uncharacterized protein n=1 Tax=Spizellomyces punctatus (strain DAOM BR117) TaxID=645134 RepID=A0A0L0HF32_SPIPD|nr:uncharacterized protein SPPG_09253 [Spizellomyces punctatus DAOM BR117]KNC99717.1 hypothetical protein SPPG_09253 [Spizellomyces punctatus DAOM BR117]|eukprot:XP_016607757.1 hypothetical protein SPPG_09253 [Spizellomyces punctatus DAOM BR117]
MRHMCPRLSGSSRPPNISPAMPSPRMNERHCSPLVDPQHGPILCHLSKVFLRVANFLLPDGINLSVQETIHCLSQLTFLHTKSKRSEKEAEESASAHDPYYRVESKYIVQA